MKDFASNQSFTTTGRFTFIGSKYSFAKKSHAVVSKHKFIFVFAIFHCAVPLAHTRRALGSTTLPSLSSEQHLAGKRERAKGATGGVVPVLDIQVSSLLLLYKPKWQKYTSHKYFHQSCSKFP